MNQDRAGVPGGDVEAMETYRRLAERLASTPSKEDSPGSILLTSTNAGEGCSTVSANLALALARRPGTRVLLIELDPKGSPLRPGATGPGLLQVLAGSTVLDAAVQESAVGDLALLPRGEALNGFPGGTEGEPFARLLKEAGRTYNHIVIDGQPISGLPPGILRHVDGVILVVGANHSRREAVAAGLQFLRGSGARVLGTVLNKREFFIPDWLYRRLS